jgi:hypothetical protein
MSNVNSIPQTVKCENCKVNDDDVLVETRTNGKLTSTQRLCEECAEKYICDKD